MARRFIVKWHAVNSEHEDTVMATDIKEARRLFRARTRRLGWGVTILRITVHPDDRKPNITQKVTP